MLVRSIVIATLASLMLQQAPPTFKSGVNYVEVDATVVDKQGAPVPDLEEKDFVLYEDGKPQPISTFSKIELPVEAAVAQRPATPGLAPAPADAASNPPFNGRVFVIVLDNLETAPGASTASDTKRVRDAATTFVSQDVGPNDLIAVATTGGTISQALTHDPALALRAIDAFFGVRGESAAQAAEADSEYAMSNAGGRGAGAAGAPLGAAAMNDLQRFESATAMLGTLNGLITYLAPIRDRRKAVVLFSSGIDYDLSPKDFRDDLKAQRARQLQDTLDQTTAAANRADVSFYAVDAHGMFVLDPTQFDAPGSVGSLHQEAVNMQSSLRVLSDRTNGFATLETNDFRPAFARIERENSSYYLLGFAPTTADGKVHSLSVTVRRPDLVVHSRKAFKATKIETSSSGATSASTLMDAMANPIPASGLQMQVSAAPFKDPHSGADLDLTVEVNASRFAFKDKDGAPSDAVELAVVSATQTGKTTTDAHRVITIEPRDRLDAVRARGIRFAERFAMKPGRYRLVIGAREVNGGLIGTVPLDVTVPDFAKDYPSVSGILLTSPSAAGVATSGADAALRQFLPAPPTAQRTFSRTEMLSLFAEIYTQPDAAHVPIVSASVEAADGSQAHPVAAGAPAARPGAPIGTYVYTARIPLQAFAPGQYVLRIAASDSAAGPRHERRVPFVIR